MAGREARSTVFAQEVPAVSLGTAMNGNGLTSRFDDTEGKRTMDSFVERTGGPSTIRSDFALLPLT